MSKKTLVFLILYSFSLLTFSQSTKTRGVPAYPGLLHYQQADGSSIDLYLKGDAVVHWWETSSGEKVLKKDDNSFVYACLDSESRMVISDNKVESRAAFVLGKMNIKNLGKKDIFFSKSQLKDKEKRYFKYDESLSSLNKVTRQSKRVFGVSGQKKMLLILVEFQDLKHKLSSLDFNDIMNKESYKHPLSSVVSGSFKDYYLNSSLGDFDVTTTVTQWICLPHDYAYYGSNDTNGDDSKMQEFVRDALVELENQGMDFSSFDNDMDGVVDLVNFIHAGAGEEAGGDVNTIWSHSDDFRDYTLNFDGKIFGHYVVNPEVLNNNNDAITGIGVICHEFGHAIGLPDFYDVDYGDSGGEAYGLDDWCLMASGSWNNRGINPAMINGYSRAWLGWLKEEVLSTAENLSLIASSEGADRVYRINTKTENEFFIFENRQQTGHDADIPSHGLLVYHVDLNNNGWNNNKINVNPSREGMKIVKVSKASVPFPGSSNTRVLANTTKPNLKSWANENSPYSILDISENSILINLKIEKSLNDIKFIAKSDNRLLEGTDITLIGRNPIQYIKTAKTDDKGEIVFYNLELGDYTYSASLNRYLKLSDDFSVYSDEVIELDMQPYGIEEFIKEEVKLYPNPTDGIVNLGMNLSAGTLVQVYNIVGALVYQSKYNGYLEVIDLSRNSAGIYTVVISSGEKKITRKVVLK